MEPVRTAGGPAALYSPARLERLREEVERLRAGGLISPAVRRRGARRRVQLASPLTLEGCLRELSDAQRGWEALLARAPRGLTKPRQETLLNFLDLGLVLIRAIQAAGGKEDPGGGGPFSPAEPERRREPPGKQPPGGPWGGPEPGSGPGGGEAAPRGPAGSPSEKRSDPAPISGDREEEEEEEDGACLGALREEVAVLQKEVRALQDGATREEVEDLRGKGGALASALDEFISKKIWALEQEAEVLWDAWFQNALGIGEDSGLFREKVDALKNVLQKFLWDSPLQKKVSALRKMEALRDALQEERETLCPAPLERESLWEKVTELNFALWEIQLERTFALQKVVDAFRDGLREAPQEGMEALQEKLEATQEVLRAAPLKEFSALHKITGALFDAMVDFPGVLPVQEKQDALWDALQDVPLKKMSTLWEKVRTLWGIPLQMFAVWEKVYNLELFLCDDSRNRVWNLQENVEALNDALRKALQEETGAQEGKLTALWASVQGFPLNELVALEDKLSALLEALWNILEEKPPLLKETVGASEEKLDSFCKAPLEELADLPKEEVEIFKSTLTEEIIEDDKSEFLPAWKNSGSGHGIFSATQQRDLPKTEQMIGLNVDHKMSMTSSHPDGHGTAKGQKIQKTEEMTCGDISEDPCASCEQRVPELASSEPPPKRQKTDTLHSSQVPALDQEMVREYKRYRKCVLAILNQYKSRVDKLRTRLKQSPNQTSALKYTEEAKALTCTLKKERALLQWFDCFRDLHKSRDDL